MLLRLFRIKPDTTTTNKKQTHTHLTHELSWDAAPIFDALNARAAGAVGEEQYFFFVLFYVDYTKYIQLMVRFLSYDYDWVFHKHTEQR